MDPDRITEADVLDPEREAYRATATCVECGVVEPAALMADVEGDEGRCQACEDQLAEEERENMRVLNGYLDGLIHQSLKGYR